MGEFEIKMAKGIEYTAWQMSKRVFIQCGIIRDYRIRRNRVTI